MVERTPPARLRAGAVSRDYDGELRLPATVVRSVLNHLLSDLAYLAPWEWSPKVDVACGLSAGLYIRGLIAGRRAGVRSGFWRPFAFLLGLIMIYVPLQTYFDYLSQHMFWVHRLQHLFLHHLGPFFMVVAAPGPVLLQGLPRRWRERSAQLLSAALVRRPAWSAALGWCVRLLRNPYLAGLIFVGLVYYWLIPSVHFTAMLDANRYRLMNWSMAADGVLFWWLMLTPRRQQGIAGIAYGPRIAVLAATGFLQLSLGAYIVMTPTALYNVYAICGRAWAISPIVDQQVGGCLTWIPTSMMSLVGVLVVLHHLLRDSEHSEAQRSQTLRSRAARERQGAPAALAGQP
jgi:putative membrane protein